jgi:hypothetical protein
VLLELDGGSKQQEEGNREVVVRKWVEAPNNNNNNNNKRRGRNNKCWIAGRPCLELDFLLDIVLFSNFMHVLFLLYVYKNYALI